MRAFVLALTVTVAAAGPRVIYTKDFPGSTPPWVSITIEQSGAGEYKEAADDDNPVKFQLSGDETREIFRLADKLDHFSHPLESNLKIARMGLKTFRYEDGATKNEQKFNYSLDEDARTLADWFERITESEQNLIRLERTVKYDRLGVNDAILQLQISWDRKRIVAAEQYLPLLDRVIKNDAYLHMARERAATLADAIRTQKPAKPE